MIRTEALQEEERQRRMSEDPESPSNKSALEAFRKANQESAKKAVERERSRRLDLTQEVEQQSKLVRQTSQASAIKQAEAERTRRLSVPNGGRNGGGAIRGELHLLAGFLLSSLVVVMLLILTFEETATKSVSERGCARGCVARTALRELRCASCVQCACRLAAFF